MPNQRDGGADDPPTDVPRLEKLDSPTGSPPSASLSGLMELEKCVSNLSLAHEIVVNGDFCLKPRSPPADSLEGRVTEIMHRAFWDSLGQQLSSEPPDYSHAVILLQEVKTMLSSLLLPGHVRLRAQLDEVLDMELIQQQVSHGALDLERLARYLISTMASLCAPVRDPEVKALRDLKGPVELFREIFRVLGLMKTDMVNFTIQSLRPHLVQQAAQYERAKFQQILDRQPASLDHTSSWLEAAAAEEEEAAVAAAAGGSDSSGPDSRAPVSAAAVLNRAYVRLLRWDPQDQKYPETVLMDRARLEALGRKLRTLVLEASVLLLLSGAQRGGAALPPPGFVGNLRRSVAALLEGRHTRDEDLKGALQSVADTVLQPGGGGGAAATAASDVLRGQICDLWRSDNPVRTLIGERAQTFLRTWLQAGGAKRVPEPPASLGPAGGELAQLAAAFGRVVHFNRSVFGPFYAPILRRLLLPPPPPPGDADGAEHSR